MELAFDDFGGQGKPILILHGLFGSSRNWRTVGRYLARYAHAYGLDLRNHGRSPSCESHTLADLTGDVEQWVADHLVENPILLGHSMGGIVGMAYSLSHPLQTAGLIVVDIAPKVYHTGHSREIQALRLDISSLRSRREIDDRMKPLIPDAEVRRFLQTNAERTDTGFRWRVNADALAGSTVLSDVAGLEGTYEGRTLFVAGGASGYLTKEDLPRIRMFFPNAELRTVSGAGHWLHHTAASEFEEILRDYFISA